MGRGDQGSGSRDQGTGNGEQGEAIRRLRRGIRCGGQASTGSHWGFWYRRARGARGGRERLHVGRMALPRLSKWACFRVRPANSPEFSMVSPGVLLRCRAVVQQLKGAKRRRAGQIVDLIVADSPSAARLTTSARNAGANGVPQVRPACGLGSASRVR